MSTLYVVSTPIGNLGDVTHRAIELLARVPHILAEDTRRTRILCRRYGIDTPLVSLHAHNEEARISGLLAWLDGGDEVALVSDAGTPLLSDPGARLVRAVIEAGHTVVPIPGASALLAALVASGLAPEPFTFYGFPARSGRARSDLLAEVAALQHTAILFESPGRLTRLLHDLEARCGPGRSVCVAREMTKVHESFVRGTLAEVRAYYDDAPARGEVAVVLGGAVSVPAGVASGPDELLKQLLEEGYKPSSAAREAARRTGCRRADAYRLAIRLAAAREGAEN